MPPGPGWFSITKRWPSFSPSLSAAIRAGRIVLRAREPRQRERRDGRCHPSRKSPARDTVHDTLSSMTQSRTAGSLILILGPRDKPRFEPAKAGSHQDAGNSEHDHACEQVRHIERIRRSADQPAETGAGAEQFGDDAADEPSPDAELEPGQDERYRGGQRHLEKDLPRGRAEGAEHFDEPFAGRAQAGFSIYGDRKKYKQHDDQHLRP